MASTVRMFERRMHIEGTFDEYVAEIRRVQKEEKKLYAEARATAMRNYGFVDKAHEAALHELYQRQFAMGKIAMEENEGHKNGRKREMDEEAAFQKAFNALPDTASVAVELDWVRAHPAMTRKARNPDTDCVQILASDIKTAPSKSAVNALQNWANNPGKFFEKLRDETRKAPIESSDSPTASDADDDVREAEELLRSI